MIKRIPLRARGKAKTRNYAVLALIVSLLAVAFLQSPLGVTKAEAVERTCPGGSDSGEGSSSCPNLSNSDIRSQRPMPSTVYRGDSRLPYVIFTRGFTARGTNNDIVSHVTGDRAGNSNYISTSGSRGLAETFARSQGLHNLVSAGRNACATARAAADRRRSWLPRQLWPSNCGGLRVMAETFVYDINPAYARNALYVPDQIRGNANLYNHYASQDEWAYVHELHPGAIRGVRVYRMTAYMTETNLINTLSITFTYDRFIINPHYGHALTIYNPGADGDSNFRYSSDLNTPLLPPNPYTRGCSAIIRCRGGGS